MNEYRKGESTAGRHSFLKSMRCTPFHPLTFNIELCVNLDSLIEHSVHLLQQGHEEGRRPQALLLCLQALSTLKVGSSLPYSREEAPGGR